MIQITISRLLTPAGKAVMKDKALIISF